jgi:hypothetical protein
MTELSADQKRTDMMFGNAVLGVLLLAAISGAFFWAILPS